MGHSLFRRVSIPSSRIFSFLQGKWTLAYAAGGQSPTLVSIPSSGIFSFLRPTPQAPSPTSLPEPGQSVSIPSSGIFSFLQEGNQVEQPEDLFAMFQSRPAGFFHFYRFEDWLMEQSFTPQKGFNPVQRDFFISTGRQRRIGARGRSGVSIPSSGIFSFLHGLDNPYHVFLHADYTDVSIPSSGIFSFLQIARRSRREVLRRWFQSRPAGFFHFYLYKTEASCWSWDAWLFQSRPAGFFHFYYYRTRCADAPCPVCLTPKPPCRNYTSARHKKPPSAANPNTPIPNP